MVENTIESCWENSENDNAKRMIVAIDCFMVVLCLLQVSSFRFQVAA